MQVQEEYAYDPDGAVSLGKYFNNVTKFGRSYCRLASTQALGSPASVVLGRGESMYFSGVDLTTTRQV